MENRSTSRSKRVVVGLTLASWMTACGAPSGPSLAAVQVSNVRLQPTEGNASLCCCRVAATAESENTVPVHVTVKFFAYDENPTVPLTALVHFIRNMQPGTREPILATGLLLACSRVKDVRVEVDVTGTASVLP